MEEKNMIIEMITKRYKNHKNELVYTRTREEAENYLTINGYIKDNFDDDLWWNTEEFGKWAIIN